MGAGVAGAPDGDAPPDGAAPPDGGAAVAEGGGDGAGVAWASARPLLTRCTSPDRTPCGDPEGGAVAGGGLGPAGDGEGDADGVGDGTAAPPAQLAFCGVAVVARPISRSATDVAWATSPGSVHERMSAARAPS